MRLFILAISALGVLCAALIQAEAEPLRLKGHGGPIMAIAVRADGTTLTASFDNSVGLFDQAGTPTWLEGHKAAVKAVVPLGARAASAGDDGTIIVWDLANGSVIHMLTGHTGSIASLAVSEDGALLASAGWDARIGLWDLATGANVAFLEGHDGPVNDVAFQGETLLSASADGTVRVWELTEPGRGSGRALVRHGFGVNRLAVHAEKGWLAYGAVDGGTRAIRLADGAELADLTLDRRPILALARRGDTLAVGDGEGHVMVVDSVDWTIRHDFRAAARGPIWALAISMDGSHVIAGGIDSVAAAFPLGAGANAGAAPTLGTREPEFHRPAASMDNGERQFTRKCSICHTLTGDGGRRAGPTLSNIIGRPAGAIRGFGYSDALAGSGIVWDARTLDALFDVGPAHYVPGTHMPMQQIGRAEDRRALIEYLAENTVE